MKVAFWVVPFVALQRNTHVSAHSHTHMHAYTHTHTHSLTHLLLTTRTNTHTHIHRKLSGSWSRPGATASATWLSSQTCVLPYEMQWGGVSLRCWWASCMSNWTMHWPKRWGRGGVRDSGAQFLCSVSWPDGHRI